jgi:ureidoacrylate peracid hydrolase
MFRGCENETSAGRHRAFRSGRGEVDKYRMSGFFDTELDSILRSLSTATILFAGVNVDQCVLATLSDAACMGYD